MRDWLLAIFYAAVAAALLSWWTDPTPQPWSEFAKRVAILTPPLRWAVYLEGRCGCWLSGLLS